VGTEHYRQMARAVVFLAIVALLVALACDTGCTFDDGGSLVMQPDGFPCNPGGVCGRHHCLNGTCVESMQYTCEFDLTDRMTVVVVLLVIAGALFLVALALLFKGGEIVAKRL